MNAWLGAKILMQISILVTVFYPHVGLTCYTPEQGGHYYGNNIFFKAVSFPAYTLVLLRLHHWVLRLSYQGLSLQNGKSKSLQEDSG